MRAVSQNILQFYLFISEIVFSGQQTCLLMANDGRKVAEGLQGPRRTEMLQLCAEVEGLTQQLADFCQKGMVRFHVG